MKTSSDGIALLHYFEGCRLECIEAVRLHNEVFPRQPYHERTA